MAITKLGKELARVTYDSDDFVNEIRNYGNLLRSGNDVHYMIQHWADKYDPRYSIYSKMAGYTMPKINKDNKKYYQMLDNLVDASHHACSMRPKGYIPLTGHIGGGVYASIK